MSQEEMSQVNVKIFFYRLQVKSPYMSTITHLGRNYAMNHARANRLVVSGKSISGGLQSAVLEHKGQLLDTRLLGKIHTPYENVQFLQQETEQDNVFALPKTDHVLYAVHALPTHTVILLLPYLQPGEICTLGVVNASEVEVSTLILTIPENNTNNVAYIGPLHNFDYYFYGTITNPFLINEKPGHIMVLYGQGEPERTVWYGVENSYAWYND